MCFLFLWAVISAVWPFSPVEHLFLHVDSICITCNHLCSQINDDDDDDDEPIQAVPIWGGKCPKEIPDSCSPEIPELVLMSI